MAGIPYIKFYASDWRAGTTNTLSLDEEGLYIRACVYMWATGEPVPGNDRLAAKALCVQPLRYEKLMAGLIAKGKMIRGQGSVFNERVMEDLASYRAEQALNSARTQKGWDRRRAALTQNVELAEAGAAIKAPTPHHTPPRTPRHTPHHTGGVTTPVAAGKPNDYKDGFLQEQCQPESRIQNPEKNCLSNHATREPAPDRQAVALKEVFNGSTDSMLTDAAKWMGLEPGSPYAAKWLQSTLTACGADATARAYAALCEKQARNEPIANPISWWAKTSTTMKVNTPKPKPVKISRFGLGGPRR
jgi:uncharacterized protein YdaU (DUF1376 family)